MALTVVDIAVDGGAAGDDSSQCSFTYTFTIAGTTYSGVEMTGNGNRDTVGLMEDGTVGFVALQGDGSYLLYWADEVRVFQSCEADADGGSA